MSMKFELMKVLDAMGVTFLNTPDEIILESNHSNNHTPICDHSDGEYKRIIFHFIDDGNMLENIQITDLD